MPSGGSHLGALPPTLARNPPHATTLLRGPGHAYARRPSLLAVESQQLPPGLPPRSSSPRSRSPWTCRCPGPRRPAQDSTMPWAWNNCCRSRSRRLKVRLVTYNFLPITPPQQDRADAEKPGPQQGTRRGGGNEEVTTATSQPRSGPQGSLLIMIARGPQTGELMSQDGNGPAGEA